MSKSNIHSKSPIDLETVKNSKKEIIVAVRMPSGLVMELRDLQKINHFMDISEEIRYIVRKYCLPSIKQEPISQVISQSKFIEEKQKEKLIEELSALLSTLKSQSAPKNNQEDNIK